MEVKHVVVTLIEKNFLELVRHYANILVQKANKIAGWHEACRLRWNHTIKREPLFVDEESGK